MFRSRIFSRSTTCSALVMSCIACPTSVLLTYLVKLGPNSKPLGRTFGEASTSALAYQTVLKKRIYTWSTSWSRFRLPLRRRSLKYWLRPAPPLQSIHETKRFSKCEASPKKPLHQRSHSHFRSNQTFKEFARLVEENLLNKIFWHQYMSTMYGIQHKFVLGLA